MEGLLSLLILAVLFYAMMRWGCGAHMVHGHGGHGGHEGHGEDHAGHEGHTSPSGTVAGPPTKDPVCGMTVDEGAGYSHRYRGQEYRFCSARCRDQFAADPARFSA